MKKLLILFITILALNPINTSGQSMVCSTASQLTLNNGTVCTSGTNVGAITDNILYGTCNTIPVNMVWYTYVANGSNNSFTVTPNTLTNPEIVIYLGGCPGTGTLQNCVTATGSTPIVTSWGAALGTQVWVGIASTSLNNGTFQLCINSQPTLPGAGNICASAIPICNTPFSKPTIPSNVSGQTPNCFLSPAQQDVWVKFTITQAGLLAWTATPTNLATEFDWCLWDITGGCPGVVACCNYNYAGGSSLGFGMQAIAGNVACGYNLVTGVPQREFCPPINVTCGRTYALQIDNYNFNNSGFNLSFVNSTCLISSNAAFVATPTLVCGPSLNATIVNSSTGACAGEIWNYGDGSPTYNGLTPPAHTYTTPGTYAITATIGGVCPSSVTHFVQLLAPLAATVMPIPINCSGQCTGSASVTAVTGGDGIYTYLWSTGSTSTTVSGLCAGIYSVTISNAKCGSSITKTVNIVAPPALTLTATPSVATCGNNNGSISVSAAGGTPTYSYSINGGVFSTTSNYINLAPGTYTMAVMDSKGCQITVTVSVTQTPAPIVTVNSATACAGMPAVLTASGATTYSWSPATGLSATTGANVISTLSATTTYTVVGTLGACSGTATAIVTVNPLPVPAATNTGPYCPGNTIQLNVGAFTTYTWSGPSAFSSNLQNPTQINAQAVNAGVYTVTVTNAQGCTNTATTNVIVNPTPVIVIGSNSPVCLNNAINLTASGGTGYSWSGPNAFASTLQNPTITPAAAVNAGIYTVTVTALGCTNTATTSVTVLSPTTTATNTGPFCVGTTIQLNTPAATSYTWTGPLGFTSNVQNPTIANATTAMAGTYSVLVSAGACTAFATTNVVVNPLPTPAATNTGPYCPGNTIQLNVGASTTYTWSGPAAFGSNLQNPTIVGATTAMGGIYTVTVTDVNGCTNTATTNVIVNPTPVIVIGSNSPVCLNNAINLTASGGTAYAWSGPNAFASTLQNPTITPAAAVNAGVYTVTVTALGCTNTATTSVTVLSPTTTATNTGPFCVGTTIQLNTPAAISYTWTGPLGFTSNVQNPTITNASLAMAGTYSVLVSAGSCTANATTNVVVNPLPVPAATNTGPYCPGATIQLNVGAFTTYTWAGPAAFSSNLQNPTITGATTAMGGIYTVTVTDVNGCTNTTTTNVIVNPTPVIVIGSNSPVCLNNAINLTASGGTGYSWSGPNAFASTLQNPTITPAAAVNAGIYTVTVTALGCTNTATTSVTVLSPTTTATNTGPFCVGTTIQLNTPAAISYTWTGPLGFTSNLQNPTIALATMGMAGTYSVLVSAGSCTAFATTNVVVNALPTPTGTSNSPICFGQTLNLIGAGGTTYTWTGPSFNSNLQSPSITNATTANAGNYALAVTDANGCVNSTNVNVVVNTLPVIAVNNPTTCVNTSINLTSNGGVTYSWSGPNTFTSNVQNPTIPVAQLTMSGVYVVTVTDANGCVNTASANVNVLPLPSPTITSNSPVCTGNTLNLFGSGGVTFTWTGPGYSGPAQNPIINNVTAAANGVYTLLVSSGSCTASTTYTVVINQLPIPNIVSNSPVCIGLPINFTGSGGTSYSWSGPSGFTNATANPIITAATLSNTGTYTLTVTDANGCVNSTTANVLVNPQPIVAAAGSTVCQNFNASLTSSGGISYNWSGPAGFTSTAQNPLITNAQSVSAGQYTVVVTNANTCTNTAVATIVINPSPTPSIVTNSPICINNVLTMSGTGGVTYSWSGPNGFFSSVQNPTVLATSTSIGGIYQLTVTSSNNCTATTTINTIVNPNPVPQITSGPNKGCAPLCVQFTVTSTPPAQTVGWTFGNGSSGSGVSTSGCYNADGIYTISATAIDVNGCVGFATYTAEVYPKPVADFNHAPIKPIVNIDQEVVFTDASWGTPIVSWNWYFMNTAQYTSTLQNPTFAYTEPGTYAVTLVVKSDKGCLDTIVRPLVVGEDFGIYVPNAFTPNNDGVNDGFQPKGFGIVKYELYIFDRWGEKVFHTKVFEEAWNGTFQGRGTEICEESVYTWLINCTSVFGKAHELKGHVTLIR